MKITKGYYNLKITDEGCQLISPITHNILQRFISLFDLINSIHSNGYNTSFSGWNVYIF